MTAIKNNSYPRFIRDTCTTQRKNAFLRVKKIINIIIIHTIFLMYAIHYLYERVLTIFRMKQSYWMFTQYLRAYFLAYFLLLKLCVPKGMINFVATSRLLEIYWIATPIKNARQIQFAFLPVEFTRIRPMHTVFLFHPSIATSHERFVFPMRQGLCELRPRVLSRFIGRPNGILLFGIHSTVRLIIYSYFAWSYIFIVTITIESSNIPLRIFLWPIIRNAIHLFRVSTGCVNQFLSLLLWLTHL